MRKGLEAERCLGEVHSFARHGKRHRWAPTPMLQALLAGGLACACGQVLAEAAIKAQEGNVQHWIEYYERQRAGNLQRGGPPGEVTAVSGHPEAGRTSDPARRPDTPRDSGPAR